MAYALVIYQPRSYLLNSILRKPISAILYPHEIFIIWRPKFKLSRTPTYYLTPPLIISRPHLLSRAPTYYMAPEI